MVVLVEVGTPQIKNGERVEINTLLEFIKGKSADRETGSVFTWDFLFSPLNLPVQLLRQFQEKCGLLLS